MVHENNWLLCVQIDSVYIKYINSQRNEAEFFLYPGIDRSGAYSFWPVCLSVCLSAKTFTLAIAFEW